MNNSPLVTVCLITYNHEKYIEKSLEGIFMQKVNFPFEVIIYDDASIDNTQLILENFKKKMNKNNLRLILQEKNQYSKGIKIALMLFKKAKGKYIALCEGDDYWIDKFKLQKQFDFLEENPDCSLCCHSCYKYFERYNRFGEREPKLSKIKKKNLKHFFNKDFIFTPTIMFNKKIIDNPPDIYNKLMYEDLIIKILAGLNGNIGYLPDSMAIYRIHNKSMTKLDQIAFLKKSFISHEIISDYLISNNLYNNKNLIKFRVKPIGLILMRGNWVFFSDFLKILLSRTSKVKDKLLIYYYTLPWIINKLFKSLIRHPNAIISLSNSKKKIKSSNNNFII